MMAKKCLVLFVDSQRWSKTFGHYCGVGFLDLDVLPHTFAQPLGPNREKILSYWILKKESQGLKKYSGEV